jgi:hypothetical protein
MARGQTDDRLIVDELHPRPTDSQRGAGVTSPPDSRGISGALQRGGHSNGPEGATCKRHPTPSRHAGKFKG